MTKKITFKKLDVALEDTYEQMYYNQGHYKP